jgi:hypothetical protein
MSPENLNFKFNMSLRLSESCAAKIFPKALQFIHLNIIEPSWPTNTSQDTQIVCTYLHHLPFNNIIQTVRKPFSLKLSTVSLRLTSNGMKLIPKLLALSWDTLYSGTKGLSSSHLPKKKYTSDSSATFLMCQNNCYG